MKTVSVKVPEELDQKLTAFAEKTGESKSSLIRAAIEYVLSSRDKIVPNSCLDLAKDLRGRTREMLLAGKTDEEIINFMTERYGDFVLYRPPVAKRTAILWAAPVLLLLIGAIPAFLFIRRRSQATDVPEEGEDPFAAHGVDPKA